MIHNDKTIIKKLSYILMHSSLNDLFDEEKDDTYKKEFELICNEILDKNSLMVKGLTIEETKAIREVISSDMTIGNIASKLGLSLHRTNKLIKDATEKLFMRCKRGSISLEEDYYNGKISLNEFLDSSFFYVNMPISKIRTIYSHAKDLIHNPNNFTIRFVLSTGMSYFAKVIGQSSIYDDLKKYVEGLKVPFNNTSEFRTFSMQCSKEKITIDDIFVNQGLDNDISDILNSIKNLKNQIFICEKNINDFMCMKSELVSQLDLCERKLTQLENDKYYNVNGKHRSSL